MTLLLTKPATSIAVPVVPPVHSRPFGARGSTERLLRQRCALRADDPERVRLRAQVIEMNLPTANRLARRFIGRGERLEDLAQVAALALIKAVDGYDPARETPFNGYAIPTILGALKKHFRDVAWGMRVPRSTKDLAAAAAVTANLLGQQRGRTPTATDLADHLSVTVDELLFAVGARQAYHLASLNTPHTGTGNSDLIDVLGGPDPHYAWVDNYLSLRPLLAALPLRERRILAMRFQDEMSQTQIAARVGLSQMHVSRLLRQSLARLRAGMPG